MSSPSQSVVNMTEDLLDRLDHHFSPIDGIVAIDQMFLELPKLHPWSKRRRRSKSRIRLYRGWYAWSDLVFSYVQLGDQLHILELWIHYPDSDSDEPDVDVAFQMPE